MQIFREVYANVYFKAVFLANVYFTYTCKKPCRHNTTRSAQRCQNQKRAQIPELKDVQMICGNVTVTVAPIPGAELSETFPL